MQTLDRHTLWDLTARTSVSPRRFVSDGSSRVALIDLAQGSSLGAAREAFLDRSVMILCGRQLPAVLALMQLDGLARRLLLCPPDLADAQLPAVIAEAEVDVILSDSAGPVSPELAGVPVIACRDALVPAASNYGRSRATEWLLFTSGTTGRPKMVVHTLQSLTAPLDDGPGVASDTIWSTFYDIRRYGGLQILLRCLLGGGSLVLSHAGEAVADFLIRAGRSGVTHMSGTPSHWRRALMSGAADRMSPRYVRLSGEVADQAILNQLARFFPGAAVAHAFASTEAGVAFDVRDGLAGFPSPLISHASGKVEMRVQDGSLRIRSACIASRYLGDGDLMVDADGFIDTGDLVELRGDRYYFIGRRDSGFKVGGEKVHPEEVEEVINRHPDVLMSRVRGRRSPITGTVVVADIVVQPFAEHRPFQAINDEVARICQHALSLHKIPATLQQVPTLDIAESGKLVRPTVG
jgi:acyl-coenzyme A synthetase/AMP-(fatty) acid ligase